MSVEAAAFPRKSSTAGLRLRRRAAPRLPSARVTARGKFLFHAETKFWIKGVTYGTFAPDIAGDRFPDREAVERDFARMAEHGFNTVRVYTPPPLWLLDIAADSGLLVMVGLSWDQHVAFLDDADSIETRVRQAIRQYHGHRAILAYTIGNEIPPPIVRWYGRRRIERFLHRLYRAAKQEDPAALVTYVNFPTTEFLDLPFLDFFCFNVYLEQRERLEAYIARLQNLADERPLVLAELGLDSRRGGEQRQATTLAWQIEAAFHGGAAGAFVFAWTDEWHRGEAAVDDWDFGLVRRDRSAKPALAVVTDAFRRVPFADHATWPRISVIVCTYNGHRTIRRTFEALADLDYPDHEVIVVSDGSNDGCVALAYGYGLRVIAGPNQGLSAARNLGLRAATGAIVVYIDDDAYPDRDWLKYLAHAFLTSGHAGIGGPNIAPAATGWVADCVANAPGGPSHVLVSDREAEHVPGCNMAFRKSALDAVGGFDPQFRIAGDDVDLCWRILDRGWTIGFAPAAMVWHLRRNSIRAYWRQQKNYGKAEAMLERKWPERFSIAGHPSWTGRIYGRGHTAGLHRWRSRIYHGIWGTAPFQPLYEPPATLWEHLPLMPEWYLVNAAVVSLCLLGLIWPPLLFAAPLLAVSIGAPLQQIVKSAAGASFPTPPSSRVHAAGLRIVTGVLHVVQPLARLWGRLDFGLSPWRLRSGFSFAWPWPRQQAWWSEIWRTPEANLAELREMLLSDAARVDIGSAFDRCDLTVRAGLLGSVRVLTATEDHAGARQLIRLHFRPVFSRTATVITGLFAGLGILALMQGATAASVVLGALAALLLARTILEQATAAAACLRATGKMAARHAWVKLPFRQRKRRAR